MIWKMTVGLLFSVLVFSGCKMYDSQTAASQPGEVTRSQPPEPNLPGDAPLNNAEVVTLEQAQTRTAYHIPLPERITIQQVWIQTTSSGDAPEIPARRAVAVQFENDVLLRIYPLDRQPDWDRLIAQSKDYFKKISVNGIPGIGADPGVVIYDGEEYFNRGSVVWWVDGLKYGLYTDTVSLEELLKVAETLQ